MQLKGCRIDMGLINRENGRYLLGRRHRMPRVSAGDLPAKFHLPPNIFHVEINIADLNKLPLCVNVDEYIP